MRRKELRRAIENVLVDCFEESASRHDWNKEALGDDDAPAKRSRRFELLGAIQVGVFAASASMFLVFLVANIIFHLEP